METVPVHSKDRITFRCRLCGDCCRHIQDAVMLEPLDVYHIGKYLKRLGLVQTIEDVYERYTHPDLLEGLLPIFLLNTAGPEQACVFLENGRCSVYAERPHVCRMYPFFVSNGERGKSFSYYRCIDRNASHFCGGSVLVKDWLYDNFSRDYRAYFEAEDKILPELGRLLRALEPKEQQAHMFHILFYRFYNYDLDQPFKPQYSSNWEALRRLLQDRH